MKNIVSICADVMNVFLLHCWSIYVYLQIFEVDANVENSTSDKDDSLTWTKNEAGRNYLPSLGYSVTKAGEDHP